MLSSETLFWITLALCGATGGSEVFYKKLGREVTMDCGGVDEKKDMEWKHNTELVIKIFGRSGNAAKGKVALSKRARVNGVNLRIPSVEVGDSGVYTCSGFDTRGNRITRNHNLHVVSVSASPSDTVLIFTDVTLRCDVEGDSTAQVQWLKPPGDKRHGKTVTLKFVTLADAGKWTCQIKDNTWNELEEIEQVITVVGLLQSPAEVIAPLGGAAHLPCFLPNPSSLRIMGGGWAREAPTYHFLTLSRYISGLHWKDTDILPRVAFSQKQLTTNFTVTLENVQFADAGVYVCTVEFDGGHSLKTQLNLKVEEEKGDVITTEVTNQTLVGSSFWEKPVLGVALWFWFAVAVASFILIDLAVVIVLKHRRKKRRSFFIKRTPRQPLHRRTEWPPPLPRPEPSAANIYVFMDDHNRTM
ncbi:hypothetical protein MHYP_G00032470 [Metynnis hypsauchen]